MCECYLVFIIRDDYVHFGYDYCNESNISTTKRYGVFIQKYIPSVIDSDISFPTKNLSKAIRAISPVAEFICICTNVPVQNIIWIIDESLHLQ